MKWTKEKPNVPGWYWWRRLKGDRTVEHQCVIEVVSIHGKLFMSDTGDAPLSYYATERFKNGVQKNEWSGPLLPPDSTPLARPGEATVVSDCKHEYDDQYGTCGKCGDSLMEGT